MKNVDKYGPERYAEIFLKRKRKLDKSKHPSRHARKAFWEAFLSDSVMANSSNEKIRSAAIFYRRYYGTDSIDQETFIELFYDELKYAKRKFRNGRIRFWLIVLFIVGYVLCYPYIKN